MPNSDYSRIEKAIGFLTRQSHTQPSLEDLSDYLGLSEYHCHRLFKKWAGITPKDFLQLLTLSKAKKLLNQSNSVLNTSHSVGLSGGSRLYDLFVQHEAMTPGEYKKGAFGLEIHWGLFESPFGKMAIAHTKRGICSLIFASGESEALKHFQKNWPHAHFSKNPKKIKSIAQPILGKMMGEKTNHPMKLFLKGSPFQIKVWEALLRIPDGKVTTYQEVARFIGAPKAVRAVGTAIGSNPITYLVPCHRVIRSTGAIGNYYWGATMKTAILASEFGKTRSSDHR